MLAGFVELRKARLSAGRVEHEVTPTPDQTKDNNLRDQINDIKLAVDKLDTKVDNQTERLVRVETLVNGQHYGRRRTDRN